MFQLFALLDISPAKNDKSEAIVYLDGKDARVYRTLVNVLGTEEKAQNAIMLLGLLEKLRQLTSEEGQIRRSKTRDLFPEYVGVSYEQFQRLVEEIQSG